MAGAWCSSLERCQRSKENPIEGLLLRRRRGGSGLLAGKCRAVVVVEVEVEEGGNGKG